MLRWPLARPKTLGGYPTPRRHVGWQNVLRPGRWPGEEQQEDRHHDLERAVHGFKVFATGIRQPWQLAFPKGSSSPYVSDLGQDAPAKLNPPDFVLRVRQRDNYGFPSCNWVVPSKRGLREAFQQFGPHTDLMGMAIIGKRLYMTSFLGTTGKGPGGEVVSIPLSGGALKPVVKGFVAPTVALGVHGGSLYVGELTGQVFRVTP